MSEAKSNKLTFLGRFILIILAGLVVALVMAWIGATGNPCPHGSFDNKPLPWTAVCVRGGLLFSYVACFLMIVVSIIILNKTKQPSPPKERKIAKFALWIISVVVFINNALILPYVLCYHCDTNEGLCYENRRLIGNAKAEVKEKEGLQDDDPIKKSAVVDCFDEDFPVCPDGGEYKINTFREHVTCSEHSPHANPRR